MSDTGFVRGVPGLAAAVDPQRPPGVTGAPSSAPARPSVGRVVQYALSEVDVSHVQARRAERRLTAFNPVSPGQLFPMMVVAVWRDEFGEGRDGVNGQVLLDGEDSYWVTSRAEGREPGTWRWPERV